MTSNYGTSYSSFEAKWIEFVGVADRIQDAP